MENMIRNGLLIEHIEEGPSQVQQNTVAMNHINVEVIPPTELPVKEVFICTDVEITTSKSKNSPLSDYISDNSSEYESAGSTKCSSTQSVNEVANQQLGSEKVVSPTLLGNALKAIKNVFSPSEKGKSKPISASTPTQDEKISRDLFKETSNSDNLHNGIDSKKMDYLDVSALGARLSSISLESQSVTDDSFTTTTSRFDDSFQSTVTHLDEHNISDPQSNNQNLSNETFVQIPIDLDLDISCNETLSSQDNNLEKTMLRRNSLDNSSEAKEMEKVDDNSVLEIIKMENSEEGRGIKCSTPINGNESVVIINSTLDKSGNVEIINETIVIEGKNENFEVVASPGIRDENKTFEIKNETFNVNEKTINLDTENVGNGVNDKTFELDAKEFIREIEEKAINLEMSISESFREENEVNGVISDETFNSNNNKNGGELETTFSVNGGVVNDKTFDMGVENRQVEESGPEMELKTPVFNGIAQGDFAKETAPEILATNNNELEKNFDLNDSNGKEQLQNEDLKGNSEMYEEKVSEFEKFEDLESEIENYYISKGCEIITYEITGSTPQEFLDLLSHNVKKGSLETILETSLPENVIQSPLGTLESENNCIEAVAPEINAETQVNNAVKSPRAEDKAPEPENLELEPSVPDILSDSLINGLQGMKLSEEEDENAKFDGVLDKISSENDLETIEKSLNCPEDTEKVPELENFEVNSSVPEILAQNETVKAEEIIVEPVTPEISAQNVPNGFELIEESLESLKKASECEERTCLEPIVPETLPNVPEVAENLQNSDGRVVEFVKPEKSDVKPEISTQEVLNGLLVRNGSEKKESQLVEPEKGSFEGSVPEISNESVSNGLEEVLNLQEEPTACGEIKKIEVEPAVPEIPPQNCLKEPEITEKSIEIEEKVSECEKVKVEMSVPEIPAQNCLNEPEMPEKSIEVKEMVAECAEMDKISKELSVRDISTQNLMNRHEGVEEELMCPTGKAVEPEKVNLDLSEQVTPCKILSKTVEINNMDNLVSSIVNNELELGKMDAEPGEIPEIVEKLPGRLEKFILENCVKENGINDSGDGSEKFFECEIPENNDVGTGVPEISAANAPEREKIVKEELASNENHVLEPEKYSASENAIKCEESRIFSSTYEVKLNSQAKKPEATEIKPDESIKTESDKFSTSLIDSPFDFLNKSKNIFHALSNTPKKFEPESKDLISGMEKLKLDDSLKLGDHDDKDLFEKIENNSLLEEKLSPCEKTGSDTDLAQLIQEQFTANDIEKICSVVDEIPIANLNRQIMRASQLFEKSFHDKFFEEDEEEPFKIQNSLSPEGLDFLDSIQSKSSGRDFSRESLYVKFDPLVEPKKDAKTEILLNISPIKQPVNVVAPLTPVDRKMEEKNENGENRVKELQLEIKRLTQLYLDRERDNNEKINDYENQIAKLTGQACILENKLRESAEREKALVRKLKEQNEEIKNLQVVMEQYTLVISKLTYELEEVKKKNKEEQEVLIGERDSYMTHLQNTEAAFSDVHTKYEKSKKTIEGYKKNEVMYKSTISEQSQLLEEYKEKIMEVKEKAVRELNKIHNEMDDMKLNHAQEISRVRALLRKTELKVQALQESIDQKIKENKELTEMCDDLIAGKK